MPISRTKAHDLGHRMTEEELAELSQRIAAVYDDARWHLDAEAHSFFYQFQRRDAELRRSVEAGEASPTYYRKWRENQMGRGHRFEVMRDKCAARVVEADRVAVSYVNNRVPAVASYNYNYSMYDINMQGGDLSDTFTLMNERAVANILVNGPDAILPPVTLDEREDFIYQREQVASAVTSAIIRGKDIDEIAKTIALGVTERAMHAAMRTARTTMTTAQNAGRSLAFDDAAGMGIDFGKRWVCTFDGKTRVSHWKLDGQTVRYGELFTSVWGSKLEYPGDWYHGALPKDIYNCRCTMVADLYGIDFDTKPKRWFRDPKTGHGDYVENMPYEEWQAWLAAREKNGG